MDDGYTKELLEAAGESEERPIQAVFNVASPDLRLIARTDERQWVFDLTTYQAEVLGKRLTRAAQRGPEKHARPLSCVPHISTLDTRPYRVTMATDAPVPWSFDTQLSGGVNVSILEISAAAIAFDGMDLELRWEHDPLKVIGVVRGLVLQPGRLVATAFFFRRPFPQEIRARVDSGELSELSLGVQMEEWTSLPDGARRVTRWRPFELSIEPPGGSGDPECRIVPLKDCYGS